MKYFFEADSRYMGQTNGEKMMNEVVSGSKNLIFNLLLTTLQMKVENKYIRTS